MNRTEPVEILLELEHADPDATLLAGRYSLLDHAHALQRCMPLAEKKKVDIVVGGPYSSGALVGGAHFEYGPIPPAIADRIKKITALCALYSVPIKGAALQFSMAHPASAAVIPGASNPDRIAEDQAAMKAEIPADFWRALRKAELVAPDAPLPIDK